MVSERFELARNFCNKLWNASRFTLLNLEGFSPGPAGDGDLMLEDRWILSRLATVTEQVTQCLESYRYSEAARSVYDFAWDEFCSFYVEMVKERLGDASQRPAVQRVLAHTLDALLRLLHPMIPFITEEVWQLLARVAPQRGLPEPAAATESVMMATWPKVDASRQDTQIEQQFSEFQAVLGALREIRSRQGIAPRQEIEFCVQCEDKTAKLLSPMESYLASMAKAHSTGWGPSIQPPATGAQIRVSSMEVYVDLKDLIDVDAEIARNEKQQQKLQGQIKGKEKKLANGNFVDRAPADVVQRERDSLVQLREQLESVESALASLRRAD